MSDAAGLRFTLDPAVARLGVTGAYFVIDGLSNRASEPEFEEERQAAFARLRTAYAGERFVQDDPVLAGFRELHTAVGRSNRRFVSSPEALVARLVRSGSLPSVNLLVDLYNLVSLETRLALGAHDVARIDGDVSLRLTDGSEGFHPLGAPAPETVFPGEYGYVDGANEIICRMEVLQVEKTKVEIDTTAAFFIVQGNRKTPAEQVVAAAERLSSLARRYLGGTERFLYVPP